MAKANALNINQTGLAYFNGSQFTAPALTQHGVIVADASNEVKTLAVMDDGEILIGSTGADPVIGNITSTGSTLDITVGPGSINIESALSIGSFSSSASAQGLTLSGSVLNLDPADATHPGAVSTAAQTFAGVKTFASAPVFSGLTGLIAGNGSSAISAIGYGTAGYVLTSTGSGASFQAPASASTPWTAISANTTASVNNGYMATAALTLTLPENVADGSAVYVANLAASGNFVIAAQGDDVIRLGSLESAAAGSATSSTKGDSLKLVYYAAGNIWFASEAPQGIWDVV